MKKLCVFAIILAFILSLTRCSSDSSQIRGKLIEYHTVEEYVAPIATVVDDNDHTYFVAIMCKSVTNHGVYDEELLNAIMNKTLLDVNIHVTDGSKGKNVKLNGETITVYQAYQIDITD
ncbi:MAG: hypothetical protein ACI4EL_09545 [Candidatus Fimimorpha sp.]